MNKGSALRNIVEYLPDVERVFAIGDSYNDESMLQEAQISFAPANAGPEVLQNVNITVSSNNDRAVADMIEYLEKIGWKLLIINGYKIDGLLIIQNLYFV